MMMGARANILGILVLVLFAPSQFAPVRARGICFSPRHAMEPYAKNTKESFAGHSNERQ